MRGKMTEADIDIAQSIERYLTGDHEARSRVLEVVIPLVDEEIARFPKFDYLSEDVLDHVLCKLEAGKFQTEGATLQQFKVWVRRVARNRILTIIREPGRTTSRLDDGPEPGESIHQEEYQEVIRPDPLTMFRRVAGFHALVEPYLGPGRTVDLYAVYLFEFRRNLYLALRRESGGRRHNYVHTCELTVPWDGHEARCFRSDWPSIERLWDALAPVISDAEHIDIEYVIKVAKKLEPDCTATPDLYYNWVRRMRRILETRYEETVGPDEEPAWKLWASIILESPDVP